MKLINLQGRRVLITQSDDFMGPALARVFAALGAGVTADTRSLGDNAGLARRVVEDAGDIDVLIAHLALPAPSTPVGDVDDAEWRRVFAHLVDLLPRLLRAAGVKLARENIHLNAIRKFFIAFLFMKTYHTTPTGSNPTNILRSLF